MDSVKDSPYITNFDLVPPSPPRSNNLEFDHTSPGPYDAFEQSQQLHQQQTHLQQNPLSSPPFAHTPSYNGSYYGSPYSQHSELDFAGEEINFDILQELTANTGPMNDYEPSEYDAPQTNSLLMFTNDSDFMSPHFSPGHVADTHRTRGSPFDHSSPASSNGADNDASPNNNNERHSRASSVASNHPSPGAGPLSHSPQPGFHPSPRLAVANSFGNMSVHTPNWGTQPLPPSNLQAQQMPSPPMQHKPQSPPRLTMPQGVIDTQQHTAVPTINAPDGDDGMNGPALNIVPATPVSGGGAHGRQPVPFQQTLSALAQGPELSSSMLLSSAPPDHGGAGDQGRGQSQSNPSSRNPSPFRYERGTNNSNNISPVPSPRLPDNPANNAVMSSSGNYIFPDTQSPPQGQLSNQGQGAPQRPRSNSDNWGQPYLGGAGGSQQQQQQSNGLSVGGYAYQQQQHQIQQQQRQQMQTFTFGGPGGNKAVGAAPPANNNFLSPQPDMIRRSVSESASRLGRHGQSRSEDIRLPPPSFGGPGGQGPPGSGYQSHHGQSNSIGGTTNAGQQQYLFPPSHGDYMQQQQQQSQTPQFLHPLHNLMNPASSTGSNFGSASSQGPLPPITRSLSPGHYRRASSGSNRGAEVWGTDAGLAPPATRRMSPYPSPNASPRVRYDELEVEINVGGGMENMLGGPAAHQHQQQQLPHHQQHVSLGGGMSLGISGGGLGISGGGLGGGLGLTDIGEPPVSAGYSDDVPITGRGAYTSHLAADGASSHGGHRRAGSANSAAGDGDASHMGGSQIAKQNVTTGRTMNASIRRRKQDANFVCTVPGCGSTFTRGFNLKGHLRSHYEQKPYKCHWPGCGKGFARQHDCKRHEQLHSNYRPFECEGCRKQFARMDALNRHLRSEAGAECARVVERSKGEGGGGLGLGLVQDPEEMEMEMGEDEKKPVLTTSGPRRRNTGGSGGMGEDGEGWGVAL